MNLTIRSVTAGLASTHGPLAPALPHTGRPDAEDRPFTAISFCRRSRGLRRETGVGLIEVMVAVLVLSIGFLGVGALLATTMSTNNSAMARSMATIATYSVMDAMRADLINAKSKKYDGTVIANACPNTTATLAQVQLGAWCKQLKSTLGEASATKGTISCTTEGACTVTVVFDDSRAGVGGVDNQTVTTKAML